VNEIVWKRKFGNAAESQRLGAAYDTLFFYAKTENYFFNQLRDKTSGHVQDYIKNRFTRVDSTGKHAGKKWMPYPLANPGNPTPNLVYSYKGYLPPAKGWRMVQSKLEALDQDDRLYFPADKSQRLQEKKYLDEYEGQPINSLWQDVFVINSQATEALNYGTQKPEQLLERILQLSSKEGDLVLDIFGGSGTTASVAERLERRWITTDLGKPSCMIMRKRLIDQNAKPFLYQAIGDYQVEAAKATLGRDFRIGDLSQIVLSLYGALPLPPDVNPQRNLGQIAGIALGAGRGSKTLVLADSPNKLTGAATLKKAIAQRDSLMGGWDRVVVLGWNFEPSIGETITGLNDSRLEVLVIPPDLMDRLKKKGGLDKLRGQVRFSSLQYLTIYPVERKASTGSARTDGLAEDVLTETLTVKLKNYVLLSPEAINLDDDNRAKLQAVANKEPLALIEYWAVDPDYDGKVFRSVWQDYRGNTANDEDALRVATQALVKVEAKTGPRKVCVRVVDVFGFEAEVITTVNFT
jgi:adenine-specific DNA-methyltransferase